MAPARNRRSEAGKRVLIVLYDGFTEYEYELVVLALYHNGIPFAVVGPAAIPLARRTTV